MNEILEKIIQQENRKQILIDLYSLNKEVYEKIFAYGNEKKVLAERCYYAREYGVNCSIMRLLIDYDRYSECFALINFFKDKIDFKNFSILDYGSGAGDYGLCFARLGSNVCFYDFEHMLKCPIFRCKKENLDYNYYVVPSNNVINEKIDLIVFSEVLEHLDNPLEILKDCKEKKIKWIFTTGYPHIPDNSTYFEKSGHTLNAKNLAKECQKFLKENYKYHKIEGWHLHELK